MITIVFLFRVFLEKNTLKHLTHPGWGAQDGGERAALHQLAQPRGGMQQAHQPGRGGHHGVRVLLPDLLPAAATGTLQQAGGAVEPGAQARRLGVLVRRGPGFAVLRRCGESDWSECFRTLERQVAAQQVNTSTRRQQRQTSPAWLPFCHREAAQLRGCASLTEPRA